MAIANVQRVAKGTIGSSVSIGSGDGWATPTAGNLLVVSANSDALVTIGGTGWTAGPSVIDGNGTYTWWKVSAGTESTISATPSVSDDITITAAEYSGTAASPFDAQNSTTIGGSSGTVTTSAAVTSTASADLVVAFALLHSAGAAAPNSPSWTNSFAGVLTGASSGTPTNTTCYTFGSELLPAGAAGSYSTVCSWTSPASDRQFIILAFKAAAGGGGAVYPPTLEQRRRLLTAPRQVRGAARISTPVRDQVNPPFPFTGIKQPRRLRGLLARRGEYFMPTPPQIVATPPVLAPKPVRARLKGARLARGRASAPPVDQPAAAGHRQRPRFRLPRLFRGHTAQPVPAQVVLTAPPYLPQPVRTRLRGLRIFRSRAAAPVPAQIVVVPPSYVPAPVRARLKWLRLFRPRAAGPVAGQIATPVAPHVRAHPLAPRRGRTAMPAPAQVVVAPPAYPVRPVRARLKGLRGVRGRQAAMPAPPQVVIVPPKLPPTFARIKQHALRLVRGESRSPVPAACDCTTHRPNLGTTTRPGAGVTIRPDDGTTARPCGCSGGE